MSLCNFPSSEAVISLSYRTNATRSVRNLLSWYLPLSLFVLLPSPTRRPSLPQHFPLALRSICFEPLRALRLESELCTNLFGPLSFSIFLHTPHPAVQAGVQCPGPPREAPVGDTCCLKPSAWVWNDTKHPSLGGREAERVMWSQRGKEWGREVEIHSHYYHFHYCFLFIFPLIIHKKLSFGSGHGWLTQLILRQTQTILKKEDWKLMFACFAIFVSHKCDYRQSAVLNIVSHTVCPLLEAEERLKWNQNQSSSSLTTDEERLHKCVYMCLYKGWNSL